MIGVDAILDDAQRQERLALGGRILPVGGTARVSDEGCRHGGGVRIGSRFRNCFRTMHMRRSWFRFGGGRGDRLRRPLDDSLTDSAAPAETKHLERAPARGAVRPAHGRSRPAAPLHAVRRRHRADPDAARGTQPAGLRAPALRLSISGADSGGEGGHSPERPSLHCRTARHARR